MIPRIPQDARRYIYGVAPAPIPVTIKHHCQKTGKVYAVFDALGPNGWKSSPKIISDSLVGGPVWENDPWQ